MEVVIYSKCKNFTHHHFLLSFYNINNNGSYTVASISFLYLSYKQVFCTFPNHRALICARKLLERPLDFGRMLVLFHHLNTLSQKCISSNFPIRFEDSSKTSLRVIMELDISSRSLPLYFWYALYI